MANKTVESPQYRVAGGPTAGTDWCILDNPPPGTLAPGGVVLCTEGTQRPHADAVRAAESAWAILRRWAAANPSLAVSGDLSGNGRAG